MRDYFLFQAIKTEATGLYSRKAFERLGFEAISEILYSQYEVDGEIIFESIKNHRGTTFMIKNNSEVLKRFVVNMKNKYMDVFRSNLQKL